MSVENITIVGAGLCGTLLAIRLAQRGYRVSVYERLPDMRTAELPAGRSINLAISDRGFKALRMVGLEETVREQVIPMYGRMIHAGGETPWLSRYSGRSDEYINSVSRPGLNMILLNAAEAMPNIELHFDHACTGVDLRNGTCLFVHPGRGEITVTSDVVFGTDGGGSAVRRSMFDHSGVLRFNYSQDFLDHGYKELTIPAAASGGWQLEKHALHIWPRQQFMLIALPNLDGSFTVTLFLPFEGKPGFDQLSNDEAVLEFFHSVFPTAAEHMSDLAGEFREHPTGLLGTIRCFPWQAYDRVLVMGDAAHAVVPFYGQGMNCAMEDVVVLDEIISRHEGDWAAIFNTYQSVRKRDTDAIADLALENYYEMRDHVDNPDFILKRKIEMLLEERYPEYSSKYNLVTFNEDVPYHRAKQKGHAQDAFLLDYCRARSTVNEHEIQNLFTSLRQLTAGI